MSEEIYVVTQGCYSDYSVIAVFSTCEKAESFVRDYNERFSQGGSGVWGDEATVETRDLDPVIPEYLKLPQWFFNMKRDGSLSDSPSQWECGCFGDPKVACALGNTRSSIWCRIYAETPEAAVKIANEHRLQMIANEEWPHESQ